MGKYDKPLGESGIEWTNRTWNPTTGCDKISAGCKNCYAEALSHRLQAMGNPRYRDGFAVTLHPDKLREPASWRASEWVFVNSMSDLLHADIPDEFILAAFATMGRLAPWHRYQVLTKRAERWPAISAAVADLLGGFPRNVLPGVSVENKRALARLPFLGAAGGNGACRMLSVEPLLESLCDGDVAGLAQQFRAAKIGWVITGGEAGWHARPAVEDWFREVRDACALAEVPFFHKQFGGQAMTKEGKRGGTLAVLDGRLHHEMPSVWAAPAPSSRQPSLLGMDSRA